MSGEAGLEGSIKHNRRWFLKGAVIVGAGLGVAAVAHELNHAFGAINKGLEFYTGITSDPEAKELSGEVADLCRAYTNCHQFVEENKGFIKEIKGFSPFGDIFPDVFDRNQDYYFPPLVHEQVLKETVRQCQALFEDKGLLKMLKSPRAIRVVIHSLYQGNLDKLGAIYKQAWSFDNLIGFWGDSKKGSLDPTCLPDELLITTEEEKKRIEKAISLVKEKVKVCVPITDNVREGIDFAFWRDTGRVSFDSKMSEEYLADDEGYGKTERIKIVAHEMGHGLDIFMNPWIYTFISRENLKELLDLRWQAFRSGMKGFFANNLLNSDEWVQYTLGQPEVVDPSKFLKFTYNAMVREFLYYNDIPADDWLRVYSFVPDSQSLRSFPWVSGPNEDKYTFIADNYGPELDAVLDSFGPADIEKKSESKDYVYLELMRNILTFFIYKGIADGKYTVLNNFGKTLMIPHSSDIFFHESEHFAEAVGAYICLTIPDLTLPANKVELAQAVEQLPDIKYLTRLQEILGDGKFVALANMGKKHSA